MAGRRKGVYRHMEMTLRWYGSQFDTVTLEQIRQIPGVKGVITTLYDSKPGEVWIRESIRALKAEVDALDKIIDKRKKSLEAKEDYYNYDKKIRSQQKDVDTIKAQIAALTGVKSLLH